MLGLCALHRLARGIAEYYSLGRWSAMMCCDNKGALLLSSPNKGQIQPSAKCADIRRSFRATKHTYQGGFKYIHVYGHINQHLLWSHLNITQQLHCVCDTLAKHAVTMAISFTRRRCAHSLGQQSHRQHLWPTVFPRKQGSCPQIPYTPAEERQVDT
jgi:hypothetical protein